MQSKRALQGAFVLLATASCFLLVDCASSKAVAPVVEEIDETYLYVDDGTRVVTNTGDDDVFAHIIRNKLKSSDPNEMLKAFEAYIKQPWDSDEKDFYEHMVDLKTGSSECTKKMLRYVYAIMHLAQKSAEPAIQSYVGFVRAFGPARYGKCAEQTKRQFERAVVQVPEPAQEGLDEFFSVLGGEEKPLEDDERLLEIAKSVKSLTTQSYKINKVLKVAQGFKTFVKEIEPWAIISRFLGTACDQIQSPLQIVFGIYNLAKALGAEVPADVTTNFHKLNEYNRVCLTWEKNLDMARVNLKRQIATQAPWLAAINDPFYG